MNYRRIYNKLIMRAFYRTTLLSYSERHHVIPRCLGGDNASDNLVTLTAAEHYIAHLLLIKMYPNNRKMYLPIILMSKNIGIGKRNKLVALAKEQAAAAHRGTKRSEETRKKISEAASRSFKNNPERGKAIAERNRQIIVTDAFRIKMAEIGKERGGPMIGRSHSDEAKAKIGAALIGNKRAEGHRHSPEARAKFSEQRKGNKHALGLTHSEETKRIISEKSKARWARVKFRKMLKTEILPVWAAV